MPVWQQPSLYGDEIFEDWLTQCIDLHTQELHRNLLNKRTHSP